MTRVDNYLYMIHTIKRNKLVAIPGSLWRETTVPLNASFTGLSPGLPGRLKSSRTWFQYAQWSITIEVNSVPWLHWITSGRPRSDVSLLRTITTCAARKLFWKWFFGELFQGSFWDVLLFVNYPRYSFSQWTFCFSYL